MLCCVFNLTGARHASSAAHSAAEKQSIMNQFSAIIALVFAVLFCGNLQAQQADSVKTAVLKVVNLHCDGDMPAIKKQLLNQEGIDDVRFTGRNGTASTFTVTYHSAATNQSQIETAIEATPGCDDQGETPYRIKRERAKAKR
jgi:copper chaperone CopZ